MSNRDIRGQISKLHPCNIFIIPPAVQYAIKNQEALMGSH